MHTISRNVLAMTVIAASGFLATSSTALAQEKKRAERDEKGPALKLEGRYTIVSGEKDGKAIPEAEINGSIVVFTADKIVGTDKDKKEFFASTYSLDTTHTPWLIKMKSTTSKDAEALGLLKQDGGAVTIIYALPGGEAPKEFKTRQNQHLFVLKKISGKPDNP